MSSPRKDWAEYLRNYPNKKKKLKAVVPKSPNRGTAQILANWLNELFEEGYYLPNKKGEVYIPVSAGVFDKMCGVNGLTDNVRRFLVEYGFRIYKRGNTYIVKKEM